MTNKDKRDLLGTAYDTDRHTSTQLLLLVSCCRILRERASRVRKDAWEILSPDSQQADQDSQAHTRSAAQGQGSQLERYITAFSGNQTAAHKTQMQDTKPETQHQGTFVPPKWWDTELPGR